MVGLIEQGGQHPCTEAAVGKRRRTCAFSLQRSAQLARAIGLCGLCVAFGVAVGVTNRSDCLLWCVSHWLTEMEMQRC